MKISTLVTKSLTPLAYINGAGMVIAALWLLGSGIWAGLWPAVLLLVMSPLLFPFFMFPAALAAGLMRVSENSSKPGLALAMQVLSLGYMATMLTSYAMLCFHFVRGVLEEGFLWQGLVYAATGAVLPWLIFAMKDRANLLFSGLVLMMQFTMVVVILVATAFSLGYWTCFLLFWSIMVGLLCLQALYEKFLLAPK